MDMSRLLSQAGGARRGVGLAAQSGARRGTPARDYPSRARFVQGDHANPREAACWPPPLCAALPVGLTSATATAERVRALRRRGVGDR